MGSWGVYGNDVVKVVVVVKVSFDLDSEGSVVGGGVLWGYGSEAELIQAGARALCKSPDQLLSCLQEIKRHV